MTHFGEWKSRGDVMKAAFLFLRKINQTWAAGLFKMSHLQYKLEGRLNFYTCGSMSICPVSFPFIPNTGCLFF